MNMPTARRTGRRDRRWLVLPLIWGRIRPSIIHTRLARRPRLPAPVNPHPLIRIKPNHVLHRGGKTRSVYFQVLFMIAGAHELNRRIPVKEIFAALSIPDGHRGDYHSVGFEREGGDAGVGAGQFAKEGHKNSFALLRVQVRENSESAAVAQDPERSARRCLLVDGDVSKT